jgi:hypothetical protein
VFNCIWRSVLPATYVSRQAFFDTPWSSPALNRTLAFLGEPLWATQIALALFVLSRHVPLRRNARGVRGAIAAGSLYIPLQGLASNVCSTLGFLTTNNLFNAVEEIGWALIFFVALLSALLLLHYGHVGSVLADDNHDGIPDVFQGRTPPDTTRMRFFLRGLVLFSLGFIPYMAFVDVPMYLGRLQDQLDAGVVFLSLSEGALNVTSYQVPTQDWDGVWSREWVWMSFYFTWGAWSSIMLMYAPGRLQGVEEAKQVAQRPGRGAGVGVGVGVGLDEEGDTSRTAAIEMATAIDIVRGQDAMRYGAQQWSARALELRESGTAQRLSGLR